MYYCNSPDYQTLKYRVPHCMIRSNWCPNNFLLNKIVKFNLIFVPSKINRAAMIARYIGNARGGVNTSPRAMAHPVCLLTLCFSLCLPCRCWLWCIYFFFTTHHSKSGVHDNIHPLEKYLVRRENSIWLQNPLGIDGIE